MGKNVSKRTSVGRAEALALVEATLVKAQKMGLVIMPVNIPDQNGLGLVLSDCWFCIKCVRFQFGKRSENLKCKKCEGKKCV